MMAKGCLINFLCAEFRAYFSVLFLKRDPRASREGGLSVFFYRGSSGNIEESFEFFRQLRLEFYGLRTLWINIGGVMKSAMILSLYSSLILGIWAIFYLRSLMEFSMFQASKFFIKRIWYEQNPWTSTKPLKIESKY